MFIPAVCTHLSNGKKRNVILCCCFGKAYFSKREWLICSQSSLSHSKGFPHIFFFFLHTGLPIRQSTTSTSVRHQWLRSNRQHGLLQHRLLVSELPDPGLIYLFEPSYGLYLGYWLLISALCSGLAFFYFFLSDYITGDREFKPTRTLVICLHHCIPGGNK